MTSSENNKERTYNAGELWGYDDGFTERHAEIMYSPILILDVSKELITILLESKVFQINNRVLDYYIIKKLE